MERNTAYIHLKIGQRMTGSCAQVKMFEEHIQQKWVQLVAYRGIFQADNQVQGDVQPFQPASCTAANLIYLIT